MCVEFTGKWRVATRSMIAYKVAKLADNGTPQSLVHPMSRSPQSRKRGRRLGSIVQYPIGETVKCRGYGLYLHRKVSDSYSDYFAPRCVLKIRIERGSRYRLGRLGNRKTINARKITVLSRVAHPSEIMDE